MLVKLLGEKPRLLGLTASVVSGDIPVAKIENMIRNIELLTCSRLQTASDVAKVGQQHAR